MRTRDLRVVRGEERYAYSTGAIVEAAIELEPYRADAVSFDVLGDGREGRCPVCPPGFEA